jgi:nucleotide sugar dehydrogenase
MDRRPRWDSDVAVVGLGYVGLPLAVAAQRAGRRTAGFDISSKVVAQVSGGQASRVGVDARSLKRAIKGGLTVSSSRSVLEGAETYLICVPTPLSADGRPDLSAVLAATRAVGEALQAGCLVVLESTPAPGTTQERVAPLLEEVSGLKAGRDFDLAFSPERIDPGNRDFGLFNTPKIVGGTDSAATERAARFYRGLVRTVVPVSSPLAAELAKLLENTYRLVNLSLVNEFAAVCRELGVDAREVIDAAATKPFGFSPFYPGPGAGGHCIPVDPVYLNDFCERRLGRPLRLVTAAMAVNREMPRVVADMVDAALGDSPRPPGAKPAAVLLLGISYKPDVCDTRESPAGPIAEVLGWRGRAVWYHDPLVLAEERLSTGRRVWDHELALAVEAADVVVLLQDHSRYDVADIARRAVRFVNTRGGGAPDGASPAGGGDTRRQLLRHSSADREYPDS